MTSVAQEARIIRAVEQFDRYAFAAVVEVTSPAGERYYVNPSRGTCTCPDFAKQCAEGGSCKHVLMAERFITQSRQAPAVSREEIARRMSLDFPED